MESLIHNSQSGLTHVIIMQHGVTNQILALKAIDVQGNIQGVEPIPENFSKFLKVHQDPLVFMRFFASYLSRAKNPQVYTYFKIPIRSVWKILKEVEDSDDPNLLKNLLKEDPTQYNNTTPIIQSKEDLIAYLSKGKLSYTREDLLEYKRIFFECRLQRLMINQLIEFGINYGYIIAKSDIPKKCRFKGMVIKIPKKKGKILLQLDFTHRFLSTAEQIELLQKLKENIRNYKLLKQETSIYFNPKTIKKTKIVPGKNSPLPYLLQQATLVKQKELQSNPILLEVTPLESTGDNTEGLILKEPENLINKSKNQSYETKKKLPKSKAVKQEKEELLGESDQKKVLQTIENAIENTAQKTDEEFREPMDILPDSQANILSELEDSTCSTQTTIRPTVFQENQINWKQLELLGVSKETLIKTNQLELLLRGYKTNKLFWINYKADALVAKLEARISFRHNENGLITIALHGISSQPRLYLPFFDHTFTPEDKGNLLQTGNMGRVVELTNKFSQEKVPSLISIDKLTNEIVGIALDKVKIPTNYKGIDLSVEQQETLASGKSIFIQGMSSKKGTLFDAFVQYNADKRYLEFFFKKEQDLPIEYSPLGIPTSFRGVAFTLEQIIDLENGHWVYLDNLVNKQFRPYKGYVLFNFDKKVLDFYFEQP
ncbi:DUF3945 domain-containing protein [Myroides sp. LJL116]